MLYWYELVAISQIFLLFMYSKVCVESIKVYFGKSRDSKRDFIDQQLDDQQELLIINKTPYSQIIDIGIIFLLGTLFMRGNTGQLIHICIAILVDKILNAVIWQRNIRIQKFTEKQAQWMLQKFFGE